MYGFKKLASNIADKTVTNVLKNGVGENYNSLNGKSMRYDYIALSCTTITMILDGLCQQYSLKINQ